MINWTRQHDAWLAEKCEGKDWKLPFVPDYQNDQTNALRAAKAWVVKDPSMRCVVITLGGVDTYAKAVDYKKRCGLESALAASPTLAAAVAEALYRVTGGTE